jgi:hypothetical protein
VGKSVKSMSRIVKQIEIEGKPAVALFDNGALHTYILKNFIKKAPKLSIKKTYKVALGGRKITVKEFRLFQGKIEGLDFASKAIPISKIGKVNGYELDVIIGALTMEEWEIKLDLKTGKLDLEGLRRREFTEF